MADANQSDDSQKKSDDSSGATQSQPKTWSDDEVQRIIKERDSAKGKLRKIDEESQKAQEAKAIEEGKLKEVLESTKAENERLKKVEEQFNAQTTAIREQALAQLNDPKLKDIAVDLSTPKLLEFVEINKQRPSPSALRGKDAGGDDSLTPLKGETNQQYMVRMQNRGRKVS